MKLKRIIRTENNILLYKRINKFKVIECTFTDLKDLFFSAEI